MKRVRAIFILFTLGIVIVTNPAFATELPRPLATDSRIKVVRYQKNNVIPVYASNLINTQIVFGQDESIVNYQSGDSAAWSTNVNPYLRNVLNLKPTILGSNTDLDVITVDDKDTRRYYRFELISSNTPGAVSGNSKHLTYAIEFIYPEKERQATLQKLRHARLHQQKKDTQAQQRQAKQTTLKNSRVHPKAYNWNYSFHGNPNIMPRHVFDDGTFTYFELRPNQPIPAIFAVNNKQGQEAVINYRRVGNTLIAQQVSPQFTLRDGQQIASVFNNRWIKRVGA